MQTPSCTPPFKSLGVAWGNYMKNTYSELLRDPRWQKKRLKILERDGWGCKSCGDKSSTLHVHHRNYLQGKKPWEYEDHWLVTLCINCHKEEESELPTLKDAMAFCGMNGRSTSDLAIALFALSKLNLDDDVLSDVFCAIERSAKNMDCLVGLLEYGSRCRGKNASA